MFTARFRTVNHATSPKSMGPDPKKLTNHYSHRELAFEEVADPTEKQKEDVAVLLDNLINNYGYWKQGEQNG